MIKGKRPNPTESQVEVMKNLGIRVGALTKWEAANAIAREIRNKRIETSFYNDRVSSYDCFDRQRDADFASCFDWGFQ
jgi:hypothetical protein